MDTRFVTVYRIDRRTANVWGEWSSYPADKGTASINYDATLQGKSPVQETSYVRLRSLPATLFLPPSLSFFHFFHTLLRSPTQSLRSFFFVGFMERVSSARQLFTNFSRISIESRRETPCSPLRLTKMAKIIGRKIAESFQ